MRRRAITRFTPHNDMPALSQSSRTPADTTTIKLLPNRSISVEAAHLDVGQIDALLPGESPQAYAVYVDERDDIWLSDFGSNALVRFEPDTETFVSVPLPDPGSNVRQFHGRAGQVWGAASGVDKLVVVRCE